MSTKNVILKIFLPIIIFILPFFIPLYHLPIDVSLFLTVVALIFGILMGFFIATATTNYLSLNGQLAEANSILTIVYNLSSKLNYEKGQELADAIDNYLIRAIDFPLIMYAQKTEKEFYKIINIIDSIKIENGSPEASGIFPNLHSAEADLFKKRQIIVQIAPRAITFVHWLVIILLTALINLMIFSLRDGNVILNIFFGILAFCFYFLLFILYQVDNGEFLENQLAYEDVQLVFKSIGKLPYYPDFVLKNGMAKKPIDDYRVGNYIDYPKSLEKEIKIVKIRS